MRVYPGRRETLERLRCALEQRLPTLTGAQGRQIRRQLRRRGFVQTRYELGVGVMDCWTGGRGAPVILIHGFGASSEWQWSSQMIALAAERRVIAPDLLYFGGSTSDLVNPGLEHQVNALAQLMDRLDIAQADLVGVSYGGFVAQSMVTRYPERVGRLTLVDSPGSIFEEADYTHILDVFGITQLDELLLPRDHAAMVRLMKLAWHAPPTLPRFLLADARRALFTHQVAEKRALLDDLLSYMGQGHPLPPEFWSRTLLIWGAHDPIFPVSLAERVHRAWSGSRLVVIPDASHAPQLERPNLVTSVLRRHLAAA